MAQKSWSEISKFRLFTIICLSLLTSLSLTLSDELWKMRDLVSALLQAAIAGFAYMQCPVIQTAEEEEEEEEEGGAGGAGGEGGD